MAATIELYGEQATCDGSQWTSDDGDLAEMLNAMMEARRPGSPGGEDPNPALSAARLAEKELGAKVVSFDKAVRVPGRIY